MGLPYLVNDDFIYHHAKEINSPKKYFDQHTHTMYEMYFFINGQGNFLIENTMHKLIPGDLLLLRPGEHHHFIPLSPDVYERCCVHFDAALMAGYPQLLVPFNEREAGSFNLLRMDRDMFFRLIQQMDEAVCISEEFRRPMIEFVLGEMLTCVALCAKNREQFVGGDHMPSLVEKMLQYIHEHLTEPLNLDILSEQVFMTKPHISRVFKSAMKIAPMEYVTRQRIQLAQRYLREGVGAEETAVRCGFGDYSSFYRAYRRIMGRAPRKADKGDQTYASHTGIAGRDV